MATTHKYIRILLASTRIKTHTSERSLLKNLGTWCVAFPSCLCYLYIKKTASAPCWRPPTSRRTRASARYSRTWAMGAQPTTEFDARGCDCCLTSTRFVQPCAHSPRTVYRQLLQSSPSRSKVVQLTVAGQCHLANSYPRCSTFLWLQQAGVADAGAQPGAAAHSPGRQGRHRRRLRAGANLFPFDLRTLELLQPLQSEALQLAHALGAALQISCLCCKDGEYASLCGRCAFGQQPKP